MDFLRSVVITYTITFENPAVQMSCLIICMSEDEVALCPMKLPEVRLNQQVPQYGKSRILFHQKSQKICKSHLLRPERCYLDQRDICLEKTCFERVMGGKYVDAQTAPLILKNILLPSHGIQNRSYIQKQFYICYGS